MVKEAEIHKEEDKKKKESVEARNSADSIAHQTEKTLNENGDKIPSDARVKIEGALNDLKETLKNESATKEEIDQKVQSLAKCSEELYKASSAGANSANNSKKDDDVIDAEVE